MLVTILLSLVFIASICLMLYSAVALVQNKKFFGSAPKDVQAAVQDKPERFKGAKTTGGVLLGAEGMAALIEGNEQEVWLQVA